MLISRSFLKYLSLAPEPCLRSGEVSAQVGDSGERNVGLWVPYKVGGFSQTARSVVPSACSAEGLPFLEGRLQLDILRQDQPPPNNPLISHSSL